MKKRLRKEDFQVVIFGSARIKRGDKRYKRIHELAKRIAEEGHDLVTGGGPGLMDAASRGHHDGRGGKNLSSIGLTIKLPHEEKKAYHLDIVREYTEFTDRLMHFMELSDVIVVAPGGVGTLLEFFYCWQLIQVGHRNKIPIILWGKMWKGLMKWIETWPVGHKLISKKDLQCLHHVKTIDEAMVLIQKAHRSYVRKRKS